ncbi:hypothetical protein [Streptomyces sp. NPDC047976]|uniref:hypothetical protein n=1 Tax=unclassified Streptomyces TaxID=2593676 RepID=UPI003412F2C2
MEIAEQDGLVIATLDRAEAERRAWREADVPLDIARLADSEEADDDVLAELGFTARPHWVNWCAPVRSSEAEYTAALSGTERRNVRLGRRVILDESLRLVVQEGLTEELMDDFLDVYDAQIAGMPRGRNFARARRERLLDAAAEHIGVSVYAGPTMVAGSLWRVRPEPSVLQMRFSASAPDARSGRVLRAVYAEALEYARGRGLAHASLGNDPSLFGHVVQPGLFNFKSRFGFTPVPSQILDPHLGGEYADRFLSLRSLADPTLVVASGGYRGTSPALPEALSARGHDLLLLSVNPAEEAAAGFLTGAFRNVSVLPVPAGAAD